MTVAWIFYNPTHNPNLGKLAARMYMNDEICWIIVTSKNILNILLWSLMLLLGESFVFLCTPMFLIERINKSHEEVPSAVSRVIGTLVVVTRANITELGFLEPT